MRFSSGSDAPASADKKRSLDVLNINTGARFTTYAIEAPRGSKTIGINGAAARLVQPDDLVIIISYIQIDPEAAKSHDPKVLTLTPR